MVLQLRISAQAEAALREQARKAGTDLETFATRQLERAAQITSLGDLLGPTPPSDADAMTDEDLSSFLEGEIHAARAERRAKPNP
jgi:hypothetical protein